jgi:DNA replication protein DnaC
MLLEPMIDKLHSLKLHGMVTALEEQRRDAEYTQLSFEDRLGMLVERQYLEQRQRSLTARLRYAGLKDTGPAPEDINYRIRRGLSRSELEPLLAPDWIRQGRNALFTGPTGMGKSYLAEAIARQACAHGYRALVFYSPKLFRALKLAELDGSLPKMLRKLARAELLMIDDFGLEKATPADYRLLLEILQDRIGTVSTLVTSQFAVGVWHELIGDPTVADAILDRLVHGAYRVELEGESIRKGVADATAAPEPA